MVRFKPHRTTAADKDFVLYASAAMTGIMFVISSFAYGKNHEVSSGAFLAALLWVLAGVSFLRRYSEGGRTIGIVFPIIMIAALVTSIIVVFLCRPLWSTI
jgi:hypothetical protein